LIENGSLILRIGELAKAADVGVQTVRFHGLWSYPAPWMGLYRSKARWNEFAKGELPQ